MDFRILFQDEHLVAIDKPPGILVHRTGISEDRVFVLQLLRDQLGKHLYPVHRLDRGTSGILLFALSAEVAPLLQAALSDPASVKTYLAILRGWIPESGTIDVALEKDGTGELQEALTSYRRLAQAEVPIPVDRYASARYALAAVRIHTGRMHQIRRHMAHVRHPVLCDRKRGDRHHNRMWEQEWGLTTMQLLAWRLSFSHPVTGTALQLEAALPEHMQVAFGRLGWDIHHYSSFQWT